ncbi:hypothetical protein CSKR_110920 [Clonorchis sinensis]|uniref:Uncharacterized protein n=1 Tax=Clonorchis sinensis TaxID=79923 RepID=A0A3R7DBA5_CLOSI|nr:hypothetical protein CSKR_110920 [Clonorchis sinensis]
MMQLKVVAFMALIWVVSCNFHDILIVQNTYGVAVPSCEQLQRRSQKRWNTGTFNKCVMLETDGYISIFSANVDVDKLSRSYHDLREPFMYWLVNRILNLEARSCETLVVPMRHYGLLDAQLKRIQLVGLDKDSFCVRAKLGLFFLDIPAQECFGVSAPDQTIHHVSVANFVMELAPSLTGRQLFSLLFAQNDGMRNCRYNGYGAE